MLAKELKSLERKMTERFGEHDEQFRIVFEAINQMIAGPDSKKRRRIGF